jgi:AraC-like DNA-binding protein
LRDQVLAGRKLLDLSSQLDATAVRVVRAAIHGGADCAESLRSSDWLLSHFFPMAGASAPIELRVARVAAWLRRHVPVRANMRQLGALCRLSAGRLTHLFTLELGVSIRSYLRWVKMCRAIELLGSQQTVTEAAAAIGFSDAAHFTRVLRTYYSAAPSFINNRELVRVHACSAFALQA